MIRDIIIQCSTLKTIHNLESDLWIYALSVNNSNTTIGVFNRHFNDALIEDICLELNQTVIKPLSITKTNENVFQCECEGKLDKDLRIHRYTYNGQERVMKTFKPYRLEVDALHESEVNYLKRTVPQFEVLPSYALESWQCMCSYVNQTTLRCERCGQSKHDNMIISEGTYRKGYIEDALRRAIHHDKDDEAHLRALSERLKVPFEELKQEHYILQQEQPQIVHSEIPVSKFEKINRKHMIVIGVCIIIAFAAVMLKPIVTPYFEYQKANYYMRKGRYDEARDIYKTSMDYRDSEARFFECLFLELDPLLEASSTVHDEFNNFYLVFSAVFNEYNIDQLRQRMPDDIQDLFETYINQYVEQGRYNLAIQILNIFMTEYEPYRQTMMQTIDTFYLQNEDYVGWLSMVGYYGDYMTEPRYVEMIHNYLDHQYLPMLERGFADSEEAVNSVTECMFYLDKLAELDSVNSLDRVYDIMYRSILAVGKEHEPQFNHEMSILYQVDYQDSRERFTGNFFVVTLMPYLTSDPNYVPNPVHPILDRNASSLTVFLERVGDFDPTLNYLYTSYALGKVNSPLTLNTDSASFNPISIDANYYQYMMDNTIDFELITEANGVSSSLVYATFYLSNAYQ